MDLNPDSKRIRHLIEEAEEAEEHDRPLDEPPAPDLARVAREVVAMLGPERAVHVTRAWRAPALQALPGTFLALAYARSIALEMPGLGLLAALVAAQPDALQFTKEDGRIDQIGWPARNDAALALWAIDRFPELPTGLCVHLELAKRWVDGATLEPSELLAAWRVAQATTLAATAPDAETARQMLQLVNPEADAEVQAALEKALGEKAPEGALDAQAVAIIERAAHAAYAACDGWMAYHAHRRLPSFAAESAAAVAKAVAERLGTPFWSALVARGVSMAAEAG